MGLTETWPNVLIDRRVGEYVDDIDIDIEACAAILAERGLSDDEIRNLAINLIPFESKKFKRRGSSFNLRNQISLVRADNDFTNDSIDMRIFFNTEIRRNLGHNTGKIMSATASMFMLHCLGAYIADENGLIPEKIKSDAALSNMDRLQPWRLALTCGVGAAAVGTVMYLESGGSELATAFGSYMGVVSGLFATSIQNSLSGKRMDRIKAEERLFTLSEGVYRKYADKYHDLVTIKPKIAK